ncbi:MAG: 16S rRNA (adenine(1518)-N(6)/adenine(1519)-N(6))-dimethyltransferase RsmA [Treponema sp.]|jgi:16S rRNA (adenine1518-N6/adenine1519-N6)-dimethyltransferase|nr:16S rRNA (adenine(1518)-N(6)/adenine(1519)-N(6))-dimethyltransferase RsmA [Treponema sp.]
MTVNYNSGKDLKALLDERGLGMRKKYGQNFLINEAVRNALLDALGAGTGDEVWEIGSGLGAMTRGLLDRGARVTAFEIDPGFTCLMEELFRDDDRLILVKGDVQKTWRERPPAPFLFGNLPYNIGAALLAGFIEEKRLFRRVVVMVQKETALRMAALPGGPCYSSFSVLCRSRYKVTPLMTIKGASFYPVPKVQSRGVLMELSVEEKDPYPGIFYPLVRSLFSVRRKTIKNGLQIFLFSRIIKGKPVRSTDEAGGAAREILHLAGIRENERAENLGLAAFVSLAGAAQACGCMGDAALKGSLEKSNDCRQ